MHLKDGLIKRSVAGVCKEFLTGTVKKWRGRRSSVCVSVCTYGVFSWLWFKWHLNSFQS